MALTLSNANKNNLIEILRTANPVREGALLDGNTNSYLVLYDASASGLVPFDPNLPITYNNSNGSFTGSSHHLSHISTYVSGVNAGQAHLNSPPLSIPTSTQSASNSNAAFIKFIPAISASTMYPSASCTVGLHGSGMDVILTSMTTIANTVIQPISITDMTFYLPQTLGSISLSSNLQNDLLRTILYTSGGLKNHVTNSVINFYTGEVPYSADSTASGTLLASINLGTSAPFSAPVQGISSLNTILTSATPVASGIIGYFRWVSPSPSNYVIQGSVGLPNSGSDIIVETLSITPSTPVRVTFMSLQF